jgi:hypothetical protein
MTNYDDTNRKFAHAEIDPGTQGAKRQSWHHGPRELLKQVIKKLGIKDRNALLEEFTNRALKPDNREIQETIVEYWFSNNLNSLLDRPADKRQQRVDRANKRARAERISQDIVQRVKLAAGQMLLEMMLPHGKKLRDSTGGECLVIGGWLGTVGSRMKPDQTVGEVFKEKQLQQIFKEQQ